MTDLPVNLTNGPPETILAAPDPDLSAALDAALHAEDPRSAVSAVLVTEPTYIDAWARLGGLGRDPIERYAAFRVGYHRGLDRLRASGWRGTGYVRWEHETNRGFLRALEGLRATAVEIGEDDEAERCRHFLRQLDPSWPPAAEEGTAP